MHKWTARAARVALVAAAVSAAGVGVANADDTTGHQSILGGNQLHLPIIAPIGLFGNHVNLLSSVAPGSAFRYSHVRADDDTTPQVDICGNAIASAKGVGTAACKGDANIGATEAAPASASVSASVAAPAPATAPAAASAPAPAIAGPMTGAPATAVGAPGGPAANATSEPEAPAASAAPAQAATDDDSAKAPAQAKAPDQAKEAASAPAQAKAPAAASAPAQETASAPAQATAATPAEAAVAAHAAVSAAPATRPAEMSTSGQNGLLSGNQVKAPVHAPVRICGNAGALGGMATASCDGRASSGRIGGTAVRGFGVAGLLG
jgi:hypothetical protein